MTTLRCPACHSIRVRYRFKTHELVCERCGEVFTKAAAAK